MKSVHVHGVRTGAGGLRLVLQPHDLKLVSDGKLPGLDASRDHGPATGDAECVLHRHQKGLLQVASGGGDGVLYNQATNIEFPCMSIVSQHQISQTK